MAIGAQPTDKAYLIWMRSSVIVSDLVFYFACRKLKLPLEIFFALYCNIGLILLDNIHFQYNSMMYGIMLLSIHYILVGKYLKSALLYAILINFKHIFLYSAPAFGLFYLRNCVFGGDITKGFKNLAILGFQTAFVTSVSFFPVIWKAPIPIITQIGTRLFPFERGLVHDYMASNFWALYMIGYKSVMAVPILYQ
jgi:alpha-1,3-glucosyltransferase